MFLPYFISWVVVATVIKKQVEFRVVALNTFTGSPKTLFKTKLRYARQPDLMKYIALVNEISRSSNLEEVSLYNSKKKSLELLYERNQMHTATWITRNGKKQFWKKRNCYC